MPPTMDHINEPPHSELLTIRSSRPFNAEPPVSVLVEYNITPEDLVYCRNHSPVLQFSEREYTLSLTGAGPTDLKFTIEDLKTLYPKTHVVAALQVWVFFDLVESGHK